MQDYTEYADMNEQKRYNESELAALWDYSKSHGDKISNLETIAAKLESGQDNLESKIDIGFQALQDDLQRSTKPPINILNVATLCLVILGSFGAVISYMNTQTTEAMKRENDLTNQAEIIALGNLSEDIKTIVYKMSEDDKREQQDQYDKGIVTAKFELFQEDLAHMDAQQHVRSRDATVIISKMLGRLDILEERTAQ